MFGFSNYSAKSKDFDDSNRLVVGKTKDETWCCYFKKFWIEVKGVFILNLW